MGEANSTNYDSTKHVYICGYVYAHGTYAQLLYKLAVKCTLCCTAVKKLCFFIDSVWLGFVMVCFSCNYTSQESGVNFRHFCSIQGPLQ